MPPIKKFTRDDIINVAYEIVKNEGLKKLNVRRIARELNCSVQPIFHNFENMQELENVIKLKISNKFEEIINEEVSNCKDDKPYLAVGIAYIKFAKEYPEFFKILFMQDDNVTPEEFIEKDKTTNIALKMCEKVFKLSKQEQTDIHIKAWLLAHGLACLVANKTIDYDEEELRNLLGSAVRQIVNGYKNNIR